MSRTWVILVTASLAGASAVHADTVLYRYEGDVLPHDPSAGWDVWDECSPPCNETLEDGNFTLVWPTQGELAIYGLLLPEPTEPPGSFWAEWNFRSNQAFSGVIPGCDARFEFRHGFILDSVDITGDSVISFEGGDFVLGLELDAFHTYRFETQDGRDFVVSVDGRVFLVDVGRNVNEVPFLSFTGRNGCFSEWTPNKRNSWDFIRYGTLDDGEQITTTAPRGPFVDPEAVADFDRFTVTFDQPAYVYLDDITVSGSEAIPPQVIATRRLHNGEPEVLEFLLDRALIPNETVTFTFDDGATVNEVTYTYSVDPYVPAVSEWGQVVMVLLVLVSGSLLLRTSADRAEADKEDLCPPRGQYAR